MLENSVRMLRSVRKDCVLLMEKQLHSYVSAQHAAFAGAAPQYYEVAGYGGYQALFEKRTARGSDFLKVYFDADGGIGQVCVSKG